MHGVVCVEWYARSDMRGVVCVECSAQSDMSGVVCVEWYEWSGTLIVAVMTVSAEPKLLGYEVKCIYLKI